MSATASAAAAMYQVAEFKMSAEVAVAKVEGVAPADAEAVTAPT